jgi:formylglycine-generating enzyme required for sulfatase activity
MVVIPAGTFVIGDSVFGHPQHQVTVGAAFAMAKDMVTRANLESL